MMKVIKMEIQLMKKLSGMKLLFVPGENSNNVSFIPF